MSLIGKNVTAVQGDVSKLDDLDRLYEVVRKAKGRVDVVLQNAAVVDPVPLAESTAETFDKHFALNAGGAYFTVQKALPLLADNASIILSGSAAWQMGIPGYGAYSATKAALVSFVRTWTAELAGRGIRANVISPGPTDTPMLQVGSKGTPEVHPIMCRGPTHRWSSGGPAEEIPKIRNLDSFGIRSTYTVSGIRHYACTFIFAHLLVS